MFWCFDSLLERFHLKRNLQSALKLTDERTTDVNKAAFSGSFCFLGLAVWVTVFQMNWESWGERGRDLLVVGIPESNGW